MDFLFKNFDTLAQAPGGVKKLREMILQMAVQGKLVKQDPLDQPAAELLKEIKAEKERLVEEGNPSTGLRARIKNGSRGGAEGAEIKPEEVPYEVPDGWVWTRLGEIITLNYGKSIEKTNIGGNFPAYGANGILKYVKNPYVKTKSIIVGRKGSAGALNIVDEPFWPSDVTYYITDNPRLNLFRFTQTGIFYS